MIDGKTSNIPVLVCGWYRRTKKVWQGFARAGGRIGHAPELGQLPIFSRTRQRLGQQSS